MSDVVAIATGILLLMGAGFAIVASVGLLRFPDLYSRTHAASKAGTLGSGLLLLGLAVFSQELDVATRAVAAFIFLLLTAPISSHLLARSAYIVGYRPTPDTDEADMKEYHQGQ